MSKRMSKLTALILASTMALVGCSSTGGSNDTKESNLSEATYKLDENTPAWKLDDTEDNKLTWYVNADWWNTDYGNDVITKKIKEDLNLDIEFVKGDDTKLNTYFAGEEMPDIITLFDSNSQAAQKAESWAYPLQELADTYDPYFYKVANEQILSWHELSEGKTYGYSSFSNTQDDYANDLVVGADAFIIREDIYKAIGEPSMETPEEFLSALKLIKEKYPDVTPFGFRGFEENGKTGSLGKGLQDYLGVPVEKDGEYYNRNLDEDYLAWIKVINEAYNLGLVSEDNFSDDNTIFEEKVSTGKYASIYVTGTPQLSTALQKNISQDAARKYIAIDGPKSTVGNEIGLTQSGLSGWTVTYITNKSKNPQKAIQIFTYLLSEEGQYLCNYGIEGETYDINEDGKAVLKPEVAKLREENTDKFKQDYRFGEFWFFGNDGFKVKTGESVVSPSIEQMTEWAKGKLKPQYLIENVDPDQGTQEARSLTNINSNWATTLANLLRAKDDAQFNTILEDHKKFLDENNYEAILKVRNEKMEINRQKLGL